MNGRISPRFWLGLLFVAFLAALAYFPLRSSAREGQASRAAVVIQHIDGRVDARCVSFDEAEITGLDLLRRSGLEVDLEVQGMGALVCAIDGGGCPASDCLCRCRGGGECAYWSYWLSEGRQWGYSQVGASAVGVTDGALQGWTWGPGGPNEALPPPEITFEAVCRLETSHAVPEGGSAPPLRTNGGGWAVPAAIGLGLGAGFGRAQGRKGR